MNILGIETSCDETSAAIVSSKDNKLKLLSNVVSSSLPLHARSGGIIPEIAAREQMKLIIPVISQAMEQPASPSQGGSNNETMNNIDAIAVTYGPGLLGSLLVGVETAKTLSYVFSKPLIPVNHLLGHIYANFIGEISNFKFQISNSAADIKFPLIGLIVSGGHTDLILMKKHGSIQWLGGTRDDAAGEAFDKIGRLLGLPYPGGPEIEKVALSGNPKAFNFPRPMLHSDFSAKGGPASGWDFSFSGLKTAVLREIQAMQPLNYSTICNLSASVQQAIVDVLVRKTLNASRKFNVKSILLGGGVAANQKLRKQFELEIRNLKLEIPFFVPEKWLCTDNAAMIAAAAFYNYKELSWNKLSANPQLHFN